MNDAIKNRTTQLILWLGPLTTYAISPFANYDPINLSKMLVISSIGFYVFGISFSRIKSFIREVELPLLIVSLGFVLCMTATIFLSGAPINQQFWGTFGRSTGYLTYVSLLMILMVTSSLHSKNAYENLIKVFIYCSIPETLYAIIQVAKIDPVGWSQKDIFGTFGNANFLSAFLGLASIACLSQILNSKSNIKTKLFLMAVTSINLSIIWTSGSIQGLLIFLAGSVFLILFFIRFSKKLKLYIYPYGIFALVGSVAAILGIFNKGPLAKIIFQPTVIYRSDYMHAGWAMTLMKPFYGVGLDSYGDWYRGSRGIISTLRTGPDRVSNSAHNIFLDISSNGGFPLLIFYLLFIVLALKSSIRYIRHLESFDSYFFALFSIWVAYQVQATISINQIGVGIWGWMFTGALIGHNKLRLSFEPKSMKTKGQKRKNTSNISLPADSAIFSFFFLIIGFTLAFIPLSADAKFRSASNSRDLGKMIESVKVPGSTAIHLSEVLSAALNNGYRQQAQYLVKILNSSYPNEFFGWRALYSLSQDSPSERLRAIENLKRLDPYNPDIPKS